MATANGNRILGFGDERTGIVAGAAADLVVLRRDNSVNAMFVDTLDGFIAQAGREAVDAVMIDGRWVLRDDRILTFDEVRLLADVASAQGRITERVATTLSEIDDAIDMIAAQFAPWLLPFGGAAAPLANVAT